MSISKASLEHWIRIESVLDHDVIPIYPQPKGVLPDPPNFSACIAWLGSNAGPLETRFMSAARRKASCEQRLADLKKKVLGFLIAYQWYLGELESQGLKVPGALIERNLKRYVREEMPGKGDFRRYLANSGMSESDALFIQRLTAYGERFNREIRAKPNPAAIRQALADFTSRWIAKTSCRPGYVVPGCQEYRGSEPPP